MTDLSNCQCECGETRFNVTGKPLLRAYCHCTICQAYNQAPFADITLFHEKDVLKPEAKSVEFKSHKFPPLLQRGNCVSCGKPALEYLNIPAMPQVVIIPSRNIADTSLTPEPMTHIFYDQRVADVDDGLPKHSGYLKSELALGHKVMLALLKRNKNLKNAS
ncbi:MAG: GFA family protein [Bermanella sp.]